MRPQIFPSELPARLKQEYPDRFVFFEGDDTFYVEQTIMSGMDRSRHRVRTADELEKDAGHGYQMWIAVEYGGINDRFADILRGVIYNNYTRRKRETPLTLRGTDRVVRRAFLQYQL